MYIYRYYVNIYLICLCFFFFICFSILLRFWLPIINGRVPVAISKHAPAIAEVTAIPEMEGISPSVRGLSPRLSLDSPAKLQPPVISAHYSFRIRPVTPVEEKSNTDSHAKSSHVRLFHNFEWASTPLNEPPSGTSQLIWLEN